MRAVKAGIKPVKLLGKNHHIPIIRLRNQGNSFHPTEVLRLGRGDPQVCSSHSGSLWGDWQSRRVRFGQEDPLIPVLTPAQSWSISIGLTTTFADSPRASRTASGRMQSPRVRFGQEDPLILILWRTQLSALASLRHSSRTAASCETRSGLCFVLRIGRYARINDASVVSSAGSASAQFTDRCPLIHSMISVVSAALNL